jgi:hypothetical protein
MAAVLKACDGDETRLPLEIRLRLHSRAFYEAIWNEEALCPTDVKHIMDECEPTLHGGERVHIPRRESEEEEEEV